MTYDKPFIEVTMSDGKNYRLPGTTGEFKRKIGVDGSLLTLKDIHGTSVLINAECIVRAEQYNAPEGA